MGLHTIKKGLDIPIAGAPEQAIHPGPRVSRAALVADDYVGMKPTMFVKPEDTVKRGQPLFEDKKNPGVIYTAPGAGTVKAVNRGDKRALQSVVVELNESEQAGEPSDDDFAPFENYTGKAPAALSVDEARSLLIESGMWQVFRTRPFSKAPEVDSNPDALFINAMDTEPLGPSVDLIYNENREAFEQGLTCITKLYNGRTYLCKAPGSDVTAEGHPSIHVEEFQGPHPAGAVGVHIHFLDPVHRDRTVWHINYQDVIAIGKLFTTGRLWVDRVVALSGPTVQNPRLLRTRWGASTDEIVDGELEEGENRVVSGSVLSGRTAMGEVLGYLGRFHHQISALHEGREREFLGWLTPGSEKFSIIPVYLSTFFQGKRFKFTTNTQGSERAMVPIGMYERVMPMDILPTFLLRALVVGNVEEAEQLGVLELDEEDLALCTFVCPGKYEYGPYLRQMLTQIEREG